MIKTIDMLLYEYREYSNIYNKIAVEEKNNNLIKLKRGLYETNKDADPFTIANVLLSPSYISFETALAYYGMIPERVYVIKSASFKKNKKKEYKNTFGLFLYQDINSNAYPYDINQIEIPPASTLIDADNYSRMVKLIAKADGAATYANNFAFRFTCSGNNGGFSRPSSSPPAGNSGVNSSPFTCLGVF